MLLGVHAGHIQRQIAVADELVDNLAECHVRTSSLPC